MRIRLAALPLLLLLAACGDDDNRPARTPTGTPATATPTAVATMTAASTATAPPTATPTGAPTDTTVPTATGQPTSTATAEPTATGEATVTATSEPSATATAQPTATTTAEATGTATSEPTATPTATTEPTATATGEPSATATPEVASCAGAAAAALRACVVEMNEAQRACYLADGSACAGDDAAVAAAVVALDDVVTGACPAAAAVVAAGFGDLFTPDSLIARLTAACRAETAALASRSFGGPHGASLSEADSSERACLVSAHQGASASVAYQVAIFADCIAGARDGGDCDTAAVTAEAAADTARLALAVGTACANLPALVSLDPPAFAQRAAAQARCLTAIGHGDSAPLDLDCGPRDGLIDTPRGEYVQVVLDEEQYGTRCGDGSPFAFWIRLAPEGSPVDRIVVGMQGGGVCIFGADCATRPADLFEALSDPPETTGPLSNDPAVSPFADWTKVYLPYCNQDVFIGGGTTSDFPEITVHRFGAVNVRAAMRYVRDVVWRELDRSTETGYRPDLIRGLFGGFSAGAFGTLYNYHWVLDDLQWAHTAAFPDAGLALDNGEPLGVATLGLLLINDTPPLGWGARNYMPSYCTESDCGVGPVVLEKMAPRLLGVPEQQFLILSNQIDLTQVDTTFFPSTAAWVNALRRSYCETHQLPGVNYFMPAISQNVHVISPREELYTNRPVDGVVMRDWMASVFTDPENIGSHVEEGTLVDDYPGVQPFGCP